MNARDDQTLLRAYAEGGSEEAFRELAQRYGALVYSACLRDLGRADLAEDAAQAVFVVLARKAATLRVHTSLVAWCLATARMVCRGALRAERRRRHHERPLDESIAAPQSGGDAALLEALERLRGPEREAIVLRFVQNLSLAEVGKAQGISEDAARMRVQRALGRLRERFVEGVSVSPSLMLRLAAPSSAPPHVLSLIPKLMPSTLALSSGAVALLAVAGFVATRVDLSRGVAQPPSPVVTPLQTQNTPVQSTTPVKVVVPTLDKPFTLRYHVTIHDTRSKEMREWALARTRKRYQEDIDADRRTQQEVDQLLAAEQARGEGPPIEADLTLSYDGHTLFCEEKRSDSTQILLIADNETISIRPGPRDVFAYRKAGSIVYEIALPFVGPSLPHVPIVKDGQIIVPRAVAMEEPGGNGLSYRPGFVEGGDKKPITRVSNLVVGMKEISIDRILSMHQRLGDFEIAGLCVETVFNSIIPPGQKGFRLEPTEKKEFKLVSASTEPLSSDRFKPETYLPAGTHFLIDADRGRGSNFDYDPAKGSFRDQLSAAMRGRR